MATTTEPFPEQNLDILQSPVSRRNIQRLSSLSELHNDTYTIQRLMGPTPAAVAAELALWNRDLDFDGPDHRLNAFALICIRLLWMTRTSDDADRLAIFLQDGGARALLDGLPALARLPERLAYTDRLIHYLRAALQWLFDGELCWEAQEDFIRNLQTEFRRRRAAWKSALQARLPATREELTAIVWHPRNVERWMAAAGGDATAEEHILNGFAIVA